MRLVFTFLFHKKRLVVGILLFLQKIWQSCLLFLNNLLRSYICLPYCLNTEMNQECRNAKNKHRLESAHLSVLLKIQATT